MINFLCFFFFCSLVQSLHVISSRLDCEAETKLPLNCRIMDGPILLSGGAGSGGVDGGG